MAFVVGPHSVVDVMVTDDAGTPVLFVEVKNQIDLGIDAVQPIAGHAGPGNQAYYLCVSQEVGHLWAPPDHPAAAPPTASFAIDDVVWRYVPHLDRSTWLYNEVLEQVVVDWLDELAHGEPEPDRAVSEVLERTGLRDRLAGGRVLHQVRL